MIQENEGYGDDGEWSDPQQDLRCEALDKAVDLMSSGAESGSLKMTPAEATSATLDMARSFENYLSGGEFTPTGSVPEGPMY